MRVQALCLDLDWELKTLRSLKILIHLHSYLKGYLKGSKTPKLKNEEGNVKEQEIVTSKINNGTSKILHINNFALGYIHIRAIVIFHS